MSDLVLYWGTPGGQRIHERPQSDVFCHCGNCFLSLISGVWSLLFVCLLLPFVSVFSPRFRKLNFSYTLLLLPGETYKILNMINFRLK